MIALFSRFNPFSIANCLQKFPMFFPILKSMTLFLEPYQDHYTVGQIDMESKFDADLTDTSALLAL